MYINHNPWQPSLWGSQVSVLWPAKASHALGAVPRSRAITRSRRSRRSSLSGLGNDGEIMRDSVFNGVTGAPAAGNVQAVVAQAMSTGSLYTSEDCSNLSTGPGVTNVLLGVGSKVAMKIAPMTGPAAPFVLAGAAVMQLFGAIFGAHSAKVQQEKQIICAVVRSINDSLSAIDQLYSSGQISPDQAMQALDSLYPQLQQSVQPILKSDKDHCNAACFILAEARGVIAKRKDQYSRIPPANAPAGSYVQSCRNMKVNGDVLTAECENAQNAWGPTSMSSLSTCAAIDNVNGQLKCTVTQAGVPAVQNISNSGAQALLPADVISSLTQSTGIPSWAILGLGALLLVKVL